SRARDENPIILCQSGGMTGRYLRRIFRIFAPGELAYILTISARTCINFTMLYVVTKLVQFKFFDSTV
ncbi:MAG: hypothetical protein FWH42_02605, partial [Dehalococcoidia bacterium]|nr:hypothetical protein [Dehalococcoidia bacterium]